MNRVRLEIHAEEIHKKGILGNGIGVAVLDTGISPHPDFTGRIAGFRDILNRQKGCYDDCSHGTHVCGILGGSGASSGGIYRGIAPGCHFVGVKVLDHNGNGNKEEVVEGIEWVIENKEKYQIYILNLSVGTVRENESLDQQLVDAVEKAWDAGLIVVVAAGNMGPEPMSITVPGNSRKVITVGAFDDCRRPIGRKVKPCYSGRGPTMECVCKPDVTAPGSGITACGMIRTGRQGYYTVKSGTSMATPIVSGCIALLLESEPGLTNVEVKMRIWETAVDLGLPREQQGWGRIDASGLLRGGWKRGQTLLTRGKI